MVGQRNQIIHDHKRLLFYYVNGDLNSYVRFNLQSNGVGGYYIPLYPSSDTGYSSVYGNATLDDVYGFPVDLVVGSSGILIFSNIYGSLAIKDDYFTQHGTKNNRSLRFYSTNIRCRGSFGASSLNMAIVHDTVIDYYVNGDLNSYVRFNLQSNGVGGYYIPLYPSSDTGYSSVYGNATLDDVYGFPVDLVVFDNSAVYNYELVRGNPNKKVTVINAHDGNIKVNLAINGNLSWALYGGAVQQYVNIRELTDPVISTSVHGAGWLMISDYDNNWA